jgi:hypothetical protein|tara:strand:- start:52 stop:195 length:144 start_codon:yes stop_codon:yes gene_type:complete
MRKHRCGCDKELTVIGETLGYISLKQEMCREHARERYGDIYGTHGTS